MISEINLSAITLQDCLDLYEKKGMTIIIENGNVKYILKEI